MYENFMTCNRYIPSSTKNYKFGFLSRYKVAKWDVNGKVDSMAIGPAFMG
jgi:hypothetical protein